MNTMASQITSLTIVYSGKDQRKYQSFVWGIHREFPTQNASNAKNVIWWRHHALGKNDRYQTTTKQSKARTICIFLSFLRYTPSADRLY